MAVSDTPRAAASIGQVHATGYGVDADRGQVIEVAVKVQYPGVGEALRSDLRQARLLARVMARLTRLNVTGLADGSLRCASWKNWTMSARAGSRATSRPRSPMTSPV